MMPKSPVCLMVGSKIAMEMALLMLMKQAKGATKRFPVNSHGMKQKKMQKKKVDTLLQLHLSKNGMPFKKNWVKYPTYIFLEERMKKPKEFGNGSLTNYGNSQNFPKDSPMILMVGKTILVHGKKLRMVIESGMIKREFTIQKEEATSLNMDTTLTLPLPTAMVTESATAKRLRQKRIQTILSAALYPIC